MSQERVMLLIDADNLSLDVMEQTVRLLLNQHGGVHVRRAYCTAESAVANQAAFKRLGIKPMVNLAAGKNSTDIAMAVDAIDLVLSERPDVVVIASSDSDFAPLVQRLREKGCVVRGVGQKGKVGDETQDVYDDYTVLEHRGGAAPRTAAAAKTARTPRPSRARATPAVAKAPVAKSTTPRKTASRRSSVLQTPADAEAVARADTPESATGAVSRAEETAAAPKKPATRTRKTRATKAAPTTDSTAAPTAAEVQAADPPAAATTQPALADAAPPPRRRGRQSAAARDGEAPAAPAAPQRAPAASPLKATAAAEAAPPPSSPRATLQAVLACLPELSRGQSLALNVAVQRLREARLLGKNSSSLKLFSQLTESLELLPARNPSQVRLRA